MFAFLSMFILSFFQRYDERAGAFGTMEAKLHQKSFGQSRSHTSAAFTASHMSGAQNAALRTCAWALQMPAAAGAFEKEEASRFAECRRNPPVRPQSSSAS
jgi:hypothetical protein